MGLSLRTLIIDRDDRLYRLANSKFAAMLQNPADYCFPQFAGQRVRAAETIVELVDRQATRIVRATFDILTFDDAGRLDVSTYDRHQSSRAEPAMASLLSGYPHSDGDTGVIDATSKFDAQGGSWTPSAALSRAIANAALGRTKCPQLCGVDA